MMTKKLFFPIDLLKKMKGITIIATFPLFTFNVNSGPGDLGPWVTGFNSDYPPEHILAWVQYVEYVTHNFHHLSHEPPCSSPSTPPQLLQLFSYCQSPLPVHSCGQGRSSTSVYCQDQLVAVDLVSTPRNTNLNWYLGPFLALSTSHIGS